MEARRGVMERVTGPMMNGLGSVDVYGLVSACVFGIGVLGVRTARDTVIVVLMSIELILLGVNRQLVSWSVRLDDVVGQVMSLLVLTVAAAESSVGLSILVVFFRVRGTIDMASMRVLHG